MLFQEAMTELLAGRYMARTAWDQTCEYVCLMPGMNTIWKILTIPGPNAGNWLPLIQDLIADDWKVITKVGVDIVNDESKSSLEESLDA
jgi:hypothetical protein